MVVSGLDLRLAVHALLGLDEDGAVRRLVPEEGDGGRVLEDGDAFHFTDAHPVDGPLIAVHQDEDGVLLVRDGVPVLAVGLDAADVVGGAEVLVADPAALAEDREAQELSVEGFREGDGGGVGELFAGDGHRRGGAQQFAVGDAVAEVDRRSGQVSFRGLTLRGEGACREGKRRDYRLYRFVHIASV